MYTMDTPVTDPGLNVPTAIARKEDDDHRNILLELPYRPLKQIHLIHPDNAKRRIGTSLLFPVHT